MKTYIEQLKDKYTNPHKAYKHYALSKTLLHQIVVSEDAHQEVKDILDIQQILNNYCENFIEQSFPKELHEFFGFSDKQYLIDFMFTNQNFEKLDFLEIKYEFRDLILNGEYQKKLNEKSTKITWSSLEDLIIQENNNNATLTHTVEIDTKLKKIVDDFGLVSISIGNIKTTEKLIEKIYKSLEQLSIVLNCDKKHVGLTKLNLCLDGNSEIDLYSGYLDRFKSKHLKLYVNSSVMEDVIAHEWFHFLDIVTAEYKYRDIYGEDIEKYRLWESNINRSFKKLWEKASTNETLSYIGVNEDRIISNIEHIIDKYSKLNILINPEELRTILKKECIEKKLNDLQLIEKIKKFQTHENNGLCPFILSEINLLKFDYAKNHGLSLFTTYAFCMDENMRKVNLLHKDDSYSTELNEVAARIFESYVNIILKEKNIKNIISQPEYNFYTPQKEELKLYLKEFESILDNMKINFHQIYPLSNKNSVDERIINCREDKEEHKKIKHKIL